MCSGVPAHVECLALAREMHIVEAIVAELEKELAIVVLAFHQGRIAEMATTPLSTTSRSIASANPTASSRRAVGARLLSGRAAFARSLPSPVALRTSRVR